MNGRYKYLAYRYSALIVEVVYHLYPPELSTVPQFFGVERICTDFFRKIVDGGKVFIDAFEGLEFCEWVILRCHDCIVLIICDLRCIPRFF